MTFIKVLILSLVYKYIIEYSSDKGNDSNNSNNNNDDNNDNNNNNRKKKRIYKHRIDTLLKSVK